MGARPIHLLEAGIVTEQRYAGVSEAPAALGPLFAERLAAAKRIRVPFNPRDRWLTAARESCRVLADAVAASLRAGATVGVVGGECTLVAGTISGALEVEPELMLIYLDAHGDFNTLATTPSHYVGGMCLAHVCGRQVAALLWPGVRRIADERTVLVGTRQLDPGESGNLMRSRILRVPFDRDQPDAPGLLAAVRRKPVWVHIDIDVVDPREVPAVVLPVEGGPGLGDLRELLSGIAQVSDVRGVEVCGYDPRQDPAATLPRILADAIVPAFASALVAT
ncbi:MAG: arginase [Candidatus Limnocylindrales bacterium]